MATPKAVIFGCKGYSLTREERELFAETRPFGLILFARNIEHPLQVMELTAEFRSCVDRPEAPVFVDQEGGRVARLKPPHWHAFPPAAALGRLYAKDRTEGVAAAKLLGRRLGEMLRPLGITVNCAPVADLFFKEADDVIGDRALSSDPESVGILSRAVCDGLMTAGVFPVIKHIPGHGRADADSHKALPVVTTDAATLKKTDFAPFAALRTMPFAMTAHVLYRDIDPDNCASLSKKIISSVIRKQIGFKGLLLSDDIEMKALKGKAAGRARGVVNAGCDLALYCGHSVSEMAEIAGAIPHLSVETNLRWQAARKMLKPAKLYDPKLAHAEFERLMSHLPKDRQHAG